MDNLSEIDDSTDGGDIVNYTQLDDFDTVGIIWNEYGVDSNDY